MGPRRHQKALRLSDDEEKLVASQIIETKDGQRVIAAP